MSDVIIYGPPQSSYVRTARMTCEEKGVGYELQPIELRSDALRAMHPFAKVPVLQHGDTTICETSAICRYVDDVFDGPALIPADAGASAVMETWISNVNCYLYRDMVSNYALQYIFPRGVNGQPDRAIIDAAIPNIERDLRVLDAQLANNDWITGELSLADLFIAPLMAVLHMFPEGEQALAGLTNIQRAGAAMVERPSFKNTAPPRPGS